MSNVNLILVAFLIVIVLFCLGHYFFKAQEQNKKWQSRIESINASRRSTTKNATALSLLTMKESNLERKLNALFSRKSSGQSFIRLKLLRCGIKASTEKLLIIAGLLWVTLAAGLNLIVGTILIYSIVYALIATFFIFSFILNFMQNRRRNEIIKQLSPAIDIILRGVKAGSSIDKTFKLVARETPPPLREEFEQINREIEFGVDYEKILHSAAMRVDVNDFYFFTTALIIQRQTGGSLSEILENIIRVLSQTKELRMKVKLYSSEAKTSGYVLSLLPVVVLVALRFIKPEQFEFYLHDPGGRKIIIVASALIIAGTLVIRRMTNMEV